MPEEMNKWNPETDCFWIVVNPKHLGGLTVAEAQWFDLDDYTLASRLKFEHEKEAIKYAKILAEKHDIKYVGPNFPENGILDE